MKITKEWINDTTIDIEAAVREDLEQMLKPVVLSHEEQQDLIAMYGDGSADMPKGVIKFNQKGKA